MFHNGFGGCLWPLELNRRRLGWNSIDSTERAFDRRRGRVCGGCFFFLLSGKIVLERAPGTRSRIVDRWPSFSTFILSLSLSLLLSDRHSWNMELGARTRTWRVCSIHTHTHTHTLTTSVFFCWLTFYNLVPSGGYRTYPFHTTFHQNPGGGGANTAERRLD